MRKVFVSWEGLNRRAGLKLGRFNEKGAGMTT